MRLKMRSVAPSRTYQSETVMSSNSACEANTFSSSAITTFAPGEGPNTTGAPPRSTALTVCWGYEPPATTTCAPGLATLNAASKDRHGTARVQPAPSEPSGETYNVVRGSPDAPGAAQTAAAASAMSRARLTG